MRALRHRLIDHLRDTHDAAELEELRRDVDAMGAYQVRATFGVLARETLSVVSPGALDIASDGLDEALRSPLGTIDTGTATAVAAVVGGLVFPDLRIREASSETLRLTITQQSVAPLITTLFRACDWHWPTFIAENATWMRLVWTVPTNLGTVDFDAGYAEITFETLATRYLSIGFWMAMMELFGLQNPSVEIQEVGSSWVQLGLRWTPSVDESALS